MPTVLVNPFQIVQDVWCVSDAWTCMSTLADIVRWVKKTKKNNNSAAGFLIFLTSVKEEWKNAVMPCLLSWPHRSKGKIKESNVLRLGLQSHQYGLAASAGNQQPPLGERAKTIRREGQKKRQREGERRHSTRGAWPLLLQPQRQTSPQLRHAHRHGNSSCTWEEVEPEWHLHLDQQHVSLLQPSWTRMESKVYYDEHVIWVIKLFLSLFKFLSFRTPFGTTFPWINASGKFLGHRMTPAR